MDASKITQLLQKQNTRYINRAQTVDSSTLTWKNQIQSSTYIKGVPTCRGETNTNNPAQPCNYPGCSPVNGINAYGGQGKQTNLMTGSSQQYPNVLSGASGSASQVYSSDIIMLQKAGRNSCSVPGTSPALPEVPQNAYVVLPTCYCANTNGPTDNYVSTTYNSTIQNPYPVPINNQSNPYLPAFDTYYAMKNPTCNYPTPDQNQKHFVQQCHTRFPDANNGVNVLCTDCTPSPYFTPSGQYIQPSCDGCIIEPILSTPSSIPLSLRFSYGLTTINRARGLTTPKVTFRTPVPLATSYDLSALSFYPAAYDQGQIGSCTANGIAFMYQFSVLKLNPSDTFMPSRLFIYYCERLLDYYSANSITPLPALSDFTSNNANNTAFQQQDSDTGSQDFQGINILTQYGVCSELNWPYSDDPNNYKTLPQNWATIVTDATNHKLKTAYSVGGLTGQYDITPNQIFTSGENDLDSIKHAINQQHPVVFGILLTTVTDNALNNYTNTVPPTIIDIPSSVPSMQAGSSAISNYFNTGSNFIGGHCVVIIGYDNTLQAFKIRNSWNTTWGINGHFWLSYQFIKNPNLANDFWIISDITDANISTNG